MPATHMWKSTDVAALSSRSFCVRCTTIRWHTKDTGVTTYFDGPSGRQLPCEPKCEEVPGTVELIALAGDDDAWRVDEGGVKL